MNLHYKSIPSSLILILMLIVNFSPLNVLAETVNINKANTEALQQNLSGIGPVKAKAIVDYRKKHGAFKSAKELQNVPGIGEELYKRNRNNLSTTKGLTRATARSSERSALNDENKTSPVDRKKDKASKKSKKSEKTSKEKQGKVKKEKSKKSKKKDTKKKSKKSDKDSKEKKAKKSKKDSKKKKSKKDKSKKDSKKKKSGKSKKDKK